MEELVWKHKGQLKAKLGKSLHMIPGQEGVYHVEGQVKFNLSSQIEGLG